MGKPNEARSLVEALEKITVQELIDLSEDETVRLSLAFEGFVDKIAEVVRRVTQAQRKMVH